MTSSFSSPNWSPKPIIGLRGTARFLCKGVFVLLCALAPLCLHAQSLEESVERLKKFGTTLQQEEVFLHLDNTCYFLGDTIFYKAYLRQSDGQASQLSGLLYVELFNQDGYLVERQKIRMTKGQGHGSFALADTLYGGYYELRAYTRWQLNWGEYTHPHTRAAERWFYSRKMAHEYYRDYEKLYSRVFPVYDKPQQAGTYDRNMTLRPLRRYFKDAQAEKDLLLTFYPEGGSLIAEATCGVAFQADDAEGQHQVGTLQVKDRSGQVVAEAQTEHRGRGVFELKVKQGEKYTAEFTSENGRTQTAPLPAIEEEGVAMRLSIEGNDLLLNLTARGQAAQESLGLTVTSHGILKQFEKLQLDTQGNASLTLPTTAWGTGVAQLTVFNAAGRIYADRLVFVQPTDLAGQQVRIAGISPQSYSPFAPISMDVQGIPHSTLSVAVRDAAHSEYIYDNANILTEMLLCSQLRGFVENPNEYFESHDAEHQQALDLLMRVQGWRRYAWRTMALPQQFSLTHMPERTETLLGEVNRYEGVEREDQFVAASRSAMAEAGMDADSESRSLLNEDSEEEGNEGTVATTSTQTEMSQLAQQNFENDQTHHGTTTRTNAAVSNERFYEQQGNLKREVLVHAEFAQLNTKGGVADAVEGDVMTYNKGRFKIQAPGFEEGVYFFLAASDSTRWKKDKSHIWVADGEDKGEINYPEFYVKLSPIYPRFVKPYNYYQTQLAPLPTGSKLYVDPLNDVRTLREVNVGAKRNGMREFDRNHPAFVIDAYEAFNATCDAGLCPSIFIGASRFAYDIARTYIGDMNNERAYDLEQRFGGKNLSSNFSQGQLNKYNSIANIDKVYIYTDYSPRREGDKKFDQSNQPVVTVDLHLLENGGKRATWRDRRYVLRGYSVCEDFYHPNYHNQPLPDTKDYRRTLYWNPNVTLDEKGEAKITLYNNSKDTQVSVSVEGLSPTGLPVTGSSTPEKR